MGSCLSVVSVGTLHGPRQEHCIEYIAFPSQVFVSKLHNNLILVQREEQQHELRDRVKETKPNMKQVAS